MGLAKRLEHCALVSCVVGASMAVIVGVRSADGLCMRYVPRLSASYRTCMALAVLYAVCFLLQGIHRQLASGQTTADYRTAQDSIG